MKKAVLLLLIAVLGALMCTACVTKKKNARSLDRERNAAVEAAGRMDNALNN